ncbi:MAG: phage major capsid protein [Actinobacteria bacterium]|nr:phage major capsid protein [Actinomycetota bacterium]
MALTTSGGAAILSVEQVDELVVRPLIAQSVATRVGRVVPITAGSLRLPIVSADPSAAWTAEGAEIAVSDPTLIEVDVVPKKLAGLVVVSNELAADSSPAALGVVGEGLVRDLARKIDAAFFANTTTNGPAGLLSIASTTIDAGDTWVNLDWAEQAKTLAELHNVTVDAFVCHPNTALDLASLKDETGSNRPLLQPDPTAPAARTVAGVPLLTSPAIAEDIVWSIPRSRVVVAMRSGTSVVPDSSAFFTSDRTAIRATLRVGWGFSDPAAIGKVVLTP